MNPPAYDAPDMNAAATNVSHSLAEAIKAAKVGRITNLVFRTVFSQELRRL
jgi:hypothetical protein